MQPIFNINIEYEFIKYYFISNYNLFVFSYCYCILNYNLFILFILLFISNNNPSQITIYLEL